MINKLAIAFLLLQTTFLLGASGKPNPADFPVKVHVVFSRYVLTAGFDQQIEALIDGERVELMGPGYGVLALGDYPARIAPKPLGRGRKITTNTYDIYKAYEFLMPDGKTRTYQVTAMGKSEFPLAPLPPPPATSDTPAPIPEVPVIPIPPPMIP
jgi:hypothetical protein